MVPAVLVELKGQEQYQRPEQDVGTAEPAGIAGERRKAQAGKVDPRTKVDERLDE